MAKKQIPLFIIDESVLVQMIEGDNTQKSIEVLRTISEMKKKVLPFKACTTWVCFLRAIWKAEPKESISKIQEVMETIQIVTTPEQNYKDEEKVRDDLIKFANFMSGGKK